MVAQQEWDRKGGTNPESTSKETTKQCAKEHPEVNQEPIASSHSTKEMVGNDPLPESDSDLVRSDEPNQREHCNCPRYI